MPNHFRYTVGQMMRRSGGAYSHLPEVQPLKVGETTWASNYPDNFDWRNRTGVNFVSPVRDQGNCGSCYAFASTGMLEARVRILTKNGRQDIFSTQVYCEDKDILLERFIFAYSSK